MSKIYLSTFIFIFLILVIPMFLSLGIKLVPNSFQPSLDDRQKVYKDREISQLIVADKDYFSGVGVSVRNLNLMNKKDLKMSLYKDDNLIRQVNINGLVIKDGELVKFIFEPIKESLSQTFKITFSAESSRVDEALEIFLTKNVTGEKVIIGKDFYPEGLSDVLYYKASNPLSVTLDIYKEWFKRFSADRIFFIFYTIIFGSLGFLTLKPTGKSGPK